MGEANRRKVLDPLYGVVPKTGILSPLWVVHKGVLFLVGERDSLACLPAGNMVTPNEEQLAVLEDILSNNPGLMGPSIGEAIDQNTVNTTTTGMIDMTDGSTPTTVTTINLV